MNTEESTDIVRAGDGSIDYRHYAVRAALARNGEAKKAFGKIIETLVECGPGISVLATVIMVAVIL